MGSKNYLKQDAPFRVPTDDGKLIEEHFGGASLNGAAFSVAHMVAPPGWGEPAQKPDFDEITMVVRGRKRIEVDGEAVELGPNESILVRRGARVRYCNPFAEELEYWSVCIPAFSPETVHREDPAA
ncbi:MAG: cupin [Elusimicrobia bacterium CG_4_9_14_3_um_filter_62_55]|nr:MAG: cupin [Elusimicrobia bacterium CG22_combo_CG10-13_8_21_14_all_63_91]PJA13062.1 MAG: cupin [Elusimicrobia bacterium CG_4_10_14_0_2_um_filter_63_34]PJB26617.1 MAG: cupin [Elusimicrobia bacterium CG_4_9_14_3_um_filter_62_55]